MFEICYVITHVTASECNSALATNFALIVVVYLHDNSNIQMPNELNKSETNHANKVLKEVRNL